VVNLSTRGSEGIAVAAHAGQPFELLLNVPPASRYASYRLDLYSAPGRLEWSRTITDSGSGTVSLYIPGQHVPGSDHGSPNALAVQGITSSGESVDLGRYAIDLQDSK